MTTSKNSYFKPSWDELYANQRAIAELIDEEYKRVGGFIPVDQGFVYLLHADGTKFYKIGKTRNIERRVDQISPLMPFRVRLVKLWRSNLTGYAESALHERFKEFRENGEWFALPDDVLLELLAWDKQRYEESILTPYPSLFLSSIAGSQENREAVRQCIYFLSDSTLDLAILGTPAHCQRWIESIFSSLDESYGSFAADGDHSSSIQERYFSPIPGSVEVFGACFDAEVPL